MRDESVKTNIMVEPMVGGARVESWLKGWVEPWGRSTEAEPGCVDELG